jgi:predicted DNA-binding protein
MMMATNNTKPSESQSVHLRLPPQLVARIQKLADEEGRTWANMAKRLLELQLAGLRVRDK